MVKTAQSFPDTYSVPVRIVAKRVNTNHRYRHFTQTHVTAGDEEQFEQYRTKTSCQPSNASAHSMKDEISLWNRYSIHSQSVQSTFRYIFYKFKKGVFIQIRNGRLVNFLPFSNAFFVNEWADRINIPSTLQNQKDVLPVTQWYTNNGLFRYESPCNETDTGMCQIKHMFEEVCKHHPIPDLDFFVNRRDFPLLKQDQTEPYHHIWDSETQPLVSHQYESYAPLLSSCTRDGFADIPIPTMDDWIRVCFKENIHFASTKRTMATHDSFSVPWNRKREYAVFRGSATGIGYNAETNPRIRLCEQFQNHPRCNVGITAWNTRYRKHTGDSVLHVPESTLSLSKPMTLEEQASYKYIIHVEGHVQAYRLSIELAMRSVVLLVESKYKLWYQHRLVPWVHYVPVQSDLSDLEERIEWCIAHDDECKQIAIQAREFYDQWLCKRACMEYLKDILCRLSYQCVRKHAIRREPLTQRHIQIQYLRNMKRDTYQVKGKRMMDYVQNQASLNRKKHFQTNNTTVVVYDQIFVHKTSKYPFKFDHEQFVGVYGINRILRCIPNFVYTLPTTRTNNGLYLEYVPGITLFDYIKSGQFNLNEWIFYMIQILLSISVGQRMCFLTHHDLCPWNIVLKPCDSEQVIDYLVDIQHIYRVYTTCVPVIIDFDKAHIVHDLQSFKHFFGFQPFQDALCLMISSIYNIIRYQRLQPTDQKMLLFLFNQTMNDPVYCPNVQTFEDMRGFLNEAHKYAHISFSNKGKLASKTPQDIIRLLISQYRPGYSSQSRTRVINTVEPTQRVVHTHRSAWRIRPVTELPSIHPILRLYGQQLLDCPDEYVDLEDREPILIHKLVLPIFERLSHKDYSSIPIYPSKYLEMLNMMCELVCHGGEHQLLDEERAVLIPQLQNYLNTYSEIYLYSQLLINFKLTRNIL
jgi:hypothetical protein